MAMSSGQLASFRGAVHTLCQPVGDRTSRAAAESFLDSLKHTEEGWQTLFAVLSADTWNNWTNEERLVAASQLFSASCKGKSVTGEALSKICHQLAISLRAATETNDLSTAAYISRTLIANLVRSPEVNEYELISGLLHLVGGTGGGECESEQLHIILLRLLSCVPEVVTLTGLSIHPMRRQTIITALKRDPFLLNQSNNNSSNSNNQSNVNTPAEGSLADLVTSPLQPHLRASELTQAAALNVIHAWCVHLGCVPPVGLTENSINYIHSLAARVGCGGDAANGACGGNISGVGSSIFVRKGRDLSVAAVETIAALYATCCTSLETREKEQEEQQDHVAAIAALLPVLLNCLPDLLASFSATITAAAASSSSSSFDQDGEPLAAAVTILSAATAAAATSPPNTIAYEATATFLAQSLLSLLRHPDADTRIATLAIFDTWLSTPQNLFEREPAQCFPSGDALAALLRQLVSCVNLHSLHASVLTADARDLPEEAQMMRRETTDSIKLVVTALGPPQAATLLLHLAENAHRQGDMLQLEACLYVANLIPKSSLFQSKNLPSGTKVADFDVLENLIRFGTASLLPTAPKLAGTALTLLGGLGPLLGEIFSASFSEEKISIALASAENGKTTRQNPSNISSSSPTSLLPCWTAFSQAFNAIITTLINNETSNPKLARNAATTIFRLASASSIAAQISVHLPALIEALYHWYIHHQTTLQAAAVSLNHSSMHSIEKYPNDITTSEFVLKSLCLLGGGQAQQMLLFEHARRAEDALISTSLIPSVVTMHLKSVAMVLEIVKGGLSKEGGGGRDEGCSLGESGSQLAQLLLHVATITTTSNTPTSTNKTDSCVEEADIQKLSMSILQCSGALAVVCPAMVDICIQTVGISADKDLAGALQALISIIADVPTSFSSAAITSGGREHEEKKPPLQGGSNLDDLGQTVAHVAVEISEKAFHACANPQNHGADAAFIALLHFFKVFLQQWPAAVGGGAFSASLQHVVLASLSAASQSWNRDICESSLGLASELLLNSNNYSITTNQGATTATTSTATVATAVLSCLLTAACGGQPPYMLPFISDTVYSTWIKIEAAFANEIFFFPCIFALAMASPMQLPGSGAAPWSSWTQETLSKYLNDLFSGESRKDEKKFKKVFKALCGGKKKGIEGRPPARQF